MQRITHKQVQAACDRYNKALKLSRDDCGYLQLADIAGNGDKRRATMRKTIAAIDLAIRADKLAHYQVIIQAIHSSGETQRAMLSELARRGLWLSQDQRKQAGLVA